MDEFPQIPGLYWVEYPGRPDAYDLIEIIDPEEDGEGEEGYLLMGDDEVHPPEELMSVPVKFHSALPPF